MGRMGGPQSLIRDLKTDGAANISGEPAPSGRTATAVVRHGPTSFSRETEQYGGGQAEETATRNGRDRFTPRDGLT